MLTMNDYIEIINTHLDKYLPVKYPQALFESMKYTLTLPGKRLRPVMCLEICNALRTDYKKAIPTACAIEMLHCQTLIHDDLPCMDNDDYRRGKPSNHKVFGEAIATLAGDALLTYAPEVITKYSQGIKPEVIIKILNEYFNYAGAHGVIAGQVVDIESEKNNSIENREETLNYLHEHKTSDLFQLALRTGAIIAEVDDAKLQQVTNFAKKFGIAFQITDDILDEISSFEELGKTPGKDKNSEKLTFVSLYGLDGAKCKLSCMLGECNDIMNQQGFSTKIFEDIISKLVERAGI